MIKRMRIKIIVTSMAALIILLLAIFITTNVFMTQVALMDIDNFLQNVIDNDGKKDGRVKPKNQPPRPPGEMSMISGASFKVSSKAEIREVIFNDEGLSDLTMGTYAYEILADKKDNGSIDHYRYKKKCVNNEYIIVLANTTVQNGMLGQLLTLSVSIGVMAIGILFILIIVLSKYITKPVEEAMEKQKRFISDSGHELKTPLSIISANLDMLEMEIGANSRTVAMSDGVKRMNMLIQELLVLAKTEQQSVDFRTFNLSEVMESTILPMEVVAFEQGNIIEMDIEEEIIFNGDEEGFRKMIGALMENAIKYSRKDTPIKVSLYQKGDMKMIEVYNEGIGVTKEQKEKLFDKFYRVDDSRQRETGGHGIGLSIVKNIVDKHKGKIQVESVPDKYITFKIMLYG